LHATEGVADDNIISPYLQVVRVLSLPSNLQQGPQPLAAQWRLVPTLIHACAMKKKKCSTLDGLGREEVVNWVDDMNIMTKSKK